MSTEPLTFRCQECGSSYATAFDLLTHAVVMHTEHVTYMVAWAYLDAATFACWSARVYGEGT